MKSYKYVGSFLSLPFLPPLRSPSSFFPFTVPQRGCWSDMLPESPDLEDCFFFHNEILSKQFIEEVKFVSLVLNHVCY